MQKTNDYSDIKNKRVAELLQIYENNLLVKSSKRQNFRFASEKAVLSNVTNHKLEKLSRIQGLKQENPTKKQQAQYEYLRLNAENKWLKQKGKGYLIDFDLKQRQQIRQFFNTLDKKRKGYIGLDQLEEMLLSLGLANNIEEVKQMMETVDQDHSGKIQFEEFLQMIQDSNTKNNGLVNFFKQLIIIHRNKMRKQNIKSQKKQRHKDQKQNQSQLSLIRKQLTNCPKNMPFQMLVSQIRRSHILSSLNIGRCKSKNIYDYFNRAKKGKQVVNALQKMQERRMIRGFQTSTNFYQKQ